MVNYGLGEELLKKHRSVFDGQYGVIKGLKAVLLLKVTVTLQTKNSRFSFSA